MTTSTLLATWLHKSTIVKTSTFNFQLNLPKDLFSRYGGYISAGHSSLCIQSSLSVQPCFLLLLFFFFSNFLQELKNFADFFLILLITFCTKQSHCLTQLFKNVKLTLYSKGWYICALDLPEKLYSFPFFSQIPCNVYIFD